MSDEYELLPEYVLAEIAGRCGRGFGRPGDKVPPAMTHYVQRSRIENYAVVVGMAHRYLRRGEHMDDFRDRIWQHVCAAVDLELASKEKVK